jgi:hypothetical protein
LLAVRLVHLGIPSHASSSCSSSSALNEGFCFSIVSTDRQGMNGNGMAAQRKAVAM